MTLDEMMAQVRRELDEFEKDWKKNHDKSPNMYPYTMEEPDWYEQLIVFLQDASLPKDVGL